MSFNKVITSTALAASVALGSVVPLSGAANAREWGHHGDGRDAGSGTRVEHVDPGERGEHSRYNRWGDLRNDYRSQPQWHDADADYRPHHRDHSGRNAAIGIFAAILGLAIASEASRANHYDDGDRY